MAPIRSILENVFGMLGIIFWSLQLLPQVIDNYKAKSTEGLSYSMFFIWVLCALGFGSYSIAENLSIPIILQPQIFGSLSALCYLQCLYYGKRTRWSLKKTVIGGILMFIAMAGIEVAAVYATKAGEHHQVQGTTEAAGIIPIILLAMGFVPQYVDIYREKSVVGVSMAFIVADAMGAVFSIISLCFRDTFDLLATLNYVVVLICDLIIFVFYIYYNKLNPSLARNKGAQGDDSSHGQDVEKGQDESFSCAVTIAEVDRSLSMGTEEKGAGPRQDRQRENQAIEHRAVPEHGRASLSSQSSRNTITSPVTLK
ncbi:hypothetical protein BGX34_005429 [Mortierella sp. NVP85]|nr:hypothetical protein BGX34_005429 [Mortierella sp. NVP85]